MDDPVGGIMHTVSERLGAAQVDGMSGWVTLLFGPAVDAQVVVIALMRDGELIAGPIGCSRAAAITLAQTLTVTLAQGATEQ